MKPTVSPAQALHIRATDNPRMQSTTTTSQEEIDQHHNDQQIDRYHDRSTTTDIKARSIFVSSMSKNHFHLRTTN